MTIVRTSYRYKRPPRKRRAVELKVRAIVSKRGSTAQISQLNAVSAIYRNASKDTSPPEAPDGGAKQHNRQIGAYKAKPRRSGRFGDVPDMTPEEYKRRGDAADALWRELVRRVREE